jgi:hypothetical protein
LPKSTLANKPGAPSSRRSRAPAAMVANTVSINPSIIENVDVWVRGNNGEELDPAESVIHARLVNNVNDYMFHNRQTFLVTEPQ